MRGVAWIRRHSSLGSHRSGCKKANNFLTLTFEDGLLMLLLSIAKFSVPLELFHKFSFVSLAFRPH